MRTPGAGARGVAAALACGLALAWAFPACEQRPASGDAWGPPAVCVEEQAHCVAQGREEAAAAVEGEAGPDTWLGAVAGAGAGRVARCAAPDPQPPPSLYQRSMYRGYDRHPHAAYFYSDHQQQQHRQSEDEEVHSGGDGGSG